MANDRQISKVTSNEDIPSEFILSNRQIKKVKTNKSNKLKGGPQQNFKRILNVEKLDTETAQQIKNAEEWVRHRKNNAVHK